MTTFSKDVREAIIKKCSGVCLNCGKRKYRMEIHHIVPNTKLNVKLYGNDNIQSEINGVLVCQPCHFNHALWDKQLKKAVLEVFLSKQKKSN